MTLDPFGNDFTHQAAAPAGLDVAAKHGWRARFPHEKRLKARSRSLSC
jgi:hypothetical protein